MEWSGKYVDLGVPGRSSSRRDKLQADSLRRDLSSKYRKSPRTPERLVSASLHSMFFVPRLLSSARFLFPRFCLFGREICVSTVRLSPVKIASAGSAPTNSANGKGRNLLTCLGRDLKSMAVRQLIREEVWKVLQELGLAPKAPVPVPPTVSKKSHPELRLVRPDGPSPAG
jgi:hypothetical protein